MENEDLTYKIIGSCMKVYNSLGSGFPEIIYQRALAIELKKSNLDFQNEIDKDIFYQGIKVGSRRADFIVEDKIVIELKATSNLEDIHIIQTKNYLKAYNIPFGLLVNFGSTILQYKLIFKNKKQLNSHV